MNARVAGALYLLTFITSIPTLALYRPVRDHADFVLGAGSATPVTWGIFLEIVLALCCAGTAVALFPIVRRRSETAAVGFLGSRLLEAGLILLGAVSLLTLLALRDDAAGADAASLVTAGHTLVGVYDGTFLVGQSLMPVVNAAFLATVLFRSGLVPRLIPVVGLIGVPLLLASDIAVLFGLYDMGSAPAALAALPIAAWELALGFYLLIRGLRPSLTA
ncbi:DUF4386 domain-containing protein [Paractinoplanes toevensis]|uniref:DUF4386 domain-containing protein n=1 Tax=Paractinoplanes toevensis TaxID=571911 RepID=A0A919TGV6_9ACTN|nr:DUF4386 domain-containing protein [Actinoplanes toevensis]GIM94165.1 hypothetical protein Ato02nite_059580 [Actinoplanes toevensis]